MTGGEISDNTAANQDGGGVLIRDSTFNMTGGAISGNYALKDGGGVNIDNSAFNMSGDAIISGNTATCGGGVYVCVRPMVDLVNLP
jgi:hypothetical protein